MLVLLVSVCGHRARDRLLPFVSPVQCFVVPGSALSAIVVETFKKFLLVSLIETGSVGALPSCASSPIVRGLPHYTAKYVEFGNLYSTLDSDKMLAFATENAELFQKVHCSARVLSYCFTTLVCAWLGGVGTVMTPVLLCSWLLAQLCGLGNTPC